MDKSLTTETVFSLIVKASNQAFKNKFNNRYEWKLNFSIKHK